MPRMPPAITSTAPVVGPTDATGVALRPGPRLAWGSRAAARRTQGRTSSKAGHCVRYPVRVPDRLSFTDSDEGNELIASDPMALLIGFALDQYWSVANRNPKQRA